jgi:hypothetical protein
MSPTNPLYNFGRAYLSLGADVWASSLRITSSYALRATDQVLANWGEWDLPKVNQTALLELQNYCTEIATVVPFAIERLGTDDSGVTALDQEYRGGAAFDSDAGSNYLIGDKPMMPPVRVGEASQGWALYFVPSDWAQSRVGEQTDQFVVVDAGMARTPLIVFAIDHRKSDLDSYLEIGVALLVRPRCNPRDLPGMLFLSMIVSGQFTIDASRTIWGFHKSLARNMDVRYGDSVATFCVDPRDATTLSISFPRFGSSRSTKVPCYIYCVPEGRDGVAHRTVLSRSATGEGIQIGGNVELHLSSQPNCVCRPDPAAGTICICSLLRDLRLPERPAANGWSELVSGAFGPATPCT